MSIYSVSPVSTLLHCSETSFMLVVIFGKNHSFPRVNASLATQCSLITVFSIFWVKAWEYILTYVYQESQKVKLFNIIRIYYTALFSKYL